MQNQKGGPMIGKNTKSSTVNSLDRLSDDIEYIVADQFRFARCGPADDEIRKLCEHLNVERITYEDIPCDGLLMPVSEDRYEVRVSCNAPRSRQRFSVAHELGHVVLQKLGLAEHDEAHRETASVKTHSLEERFCDAFASAVLMPRDKFQEEAERLSMSIQTFRELSRRFDVSLSAAARRYFEIMRTPAFAITTLRADRESGRAWVDKVHTNVLEYPIKPKSYDKTRPHSPVLNCFEGRNGGADWCWLHYLNRGRRVFLDIEKPRSETKTMALVFSDQPRKSAIA